MTARAAAVIGLRVNPRPGHAVVWLSSSLTRRAGLRVVGRWVVLLIALGGLLAMHGLSDHGASGAVTVSSVGAGGTTAQPMASDAIPHAGSGPKLDGDAMAVPGGGSDAGSVGGSAGGGHGDRHGGLVVGMCLAVIVSALLLGVAGLRTGLARVVRFAFSRHVELAGAVAFWARARGPAPPDLRLLSIQRC